MRFVGVKGCLSLAVGWGSVAGGIVDGYMRTLVCILPLATANLLCRRGPRSRILRPVRGEGYETGLELTAALNDQSQRRNPNGNLQCSIDPIATARVATDELFACSRSLPSFCRAIGEDAAPRGRKQRIYSHIMS